jgi:hypothetical protein
MRQTKADYATSERGTKRARRADPGNTFSRGLCDLRTRCEESAASRAMRRERGEPTRTMRPPNAMRRERGALTRTKTVLQPKADYATYGCYAKRARQADADYATSERDAMRARRADADQKNLQPSPSSGCVFIVVSVVRPSNRKTVQAPLVMWLTCVSGC